MKNPPYETGDSEGAEVTKINNFRSRHLLQ